MIVFLLNKCRLHLFFGLLETLTVRFALVLDLVFPLPSLFPSRLPTSSSIIIMSPCCGATSELSMCRGLSPRRRNNGRRLCSWKERNIRRRNWHFSWSVRKGEMGETLCKLTFAPRSSSHTLIQNEETTGIRLLLSGTARNLWRTQLYTGWSGN